MSTSKLTLSVSKEIISKAKHYAKSRGTSISFLVEQFFKELTNKEEKTSPPPSASIKQLKGVIELPSDYNYKEDMGNLYLK